MSSLETVSALAFVKGAANKYLEKTSIPVNTNLYTGTSMVKQNRFASCLLESIAATRLAAMVEFDILQMLF